MTSVDGKPEVALEQAAGRILAAAHQAECDREQAPTGPAPVGGLSRARLWRVRADLAFSGGMAVVVMALAMYAAGPGVGVVAAAGVAGLMIAVMRIRQKKR